MTDTVVVIEQPTSVTINIPGTTVIVQSNIVLVENITNNGGGGGGSAIIAIDTVDDLVKNDLVYLIGNGTVGLADPTDDSKPAYGFATESATHNTTAQIGLPVQIIEGLSGLVPGICFLGPNGSIVQDFTGLGSLQIVGTTVSSTSMLFDPESASERA